MTRNIKTKTIAGISWSVVSQIGSQAILFIVGIILARLLSPEEFGLIAMVTIITGFANLFSELGFGSAIIQKKDIKEEHLSSIFWINLLFGVIITALFILSAGFISRFYNEPVLELITVALAFNFLIGSTTIVQNALYTKAIDFKSLAIVKITAVTFSGVGSICMAYLGYGVWSLVAKGLLDSFIISIMLWYLSDWKPKILFSWHHVKELLGFSLNLLGEKSLNYWVRNLDNLLIGKVLGSSALGLYSKAYQLMLFPLNNISNVIGRVLFPSLSIIKDDKERVGRLFLKATRVIALITFPMMIGCIIVADVLVPTLFGAGWDEMIPILRVLSVVGLMQSIVTIVGSIFLSQGRADLQLRLSFIIKPILILGIIVGLQWGVLGVSVGYACAVSFAHYMNIRWAGSLVDVTYLEMIKNLRSVILCTIVMAFLVLSIDYMIPTNWGGWIKLISQFFVGCLSYLTFVHIFKVKAYREVSLIIEEKFLELSKNEV